MCVAQDIEDKLLRLLADSKGLIVDDEELISALAGTVMPVAAYCCLIRPTYRCCCDRRRKDGL